MTLRGDGARDERPLVGSPGDVYDSDGDGSADSMLLDTVGDGLVDAAVPLNSTLPFQADAQRLLVNPIFETLVATSSLALLITFALESVTDRPELSSIANPVELGFSSFFVIEFLTRWWAVGCRPRYLLTPLMLIDLLNILPVLVALSSPTSFSMSATDTPLAALCLLRAARILRLRRLLGRDEVERLVRALTADPAASVPEVTRVFGRVVLTVISIVTVSAGIEWQAERALNPTLASYTDALYFSITTLTTVGYGDIIPLTSSGRFVVGLEMLAAVTIIPWELAALSRALDETPRDAPPTAAALQGRQVVACPRCALASHEPDAIFCRRCGAVLPLRES